MSKHILVYSQYFYPEQFRVNDICFELVNRGYKVSVVTGVPNYPDGVFYEGYSWSERRQETWNGIEIYRMPIFARGKNKLGLIFNYTSFVIAARLFEHRLPKDIDLVFTYEVSPMTQALPAIAYAEKYNIPHMLYVMDLWPENVEAVAKIKSKLLIKQIEKMVDYIYQKTDRILASSQSFVKSISERGVPADKLVFWPQYAEDLYAIKEAENDVVDVEEIEELTCVFAGNIGEAQGLSILPQVAERLSQEKVKVKFVIIGDGRYKEDLLKQIKQRQVESYFYFIDRQPAYKIPYYLAKFDVALITLSSSKIFEKTIPAKVQSLMACGKPLLVSADGEVQKIVKEARSGFYGDAGNVDHFVENVKELIKMDKEELNQLGKNSLIYYQQQFDKKLLMDQFETMLGEEMNYV